MSAGGQGLSTDRRSDEGHGAEGGIGGAQAGWQSLQQALAAVAQRADGTGVYVVDARGGQDFRSYAQIHDDAQRTAGALAARGITPGARVLLLQSTGFDFLAAFFGAIRLGALPIPCAPPRRAAQFEHAAHREHFQAARALGVSALLADSGVDPGKPPQSNHTLALCTDVRELLGDSQSQPPADPQRGLEDVAYIQLTAGATGGMRGVQLTHANILSNVRAIGHALQVRPTDVGVSWVPPYNSMGLVGVICFGLYWGLDMVMIHPERFLRRPDEWFTAISRHRGTLSTAPNFGYYYALRRCQESNLRGLDLSSWRVAMNGAEPVRAQHMDAFERRFRQYGLRPDIFLPVYGLAEATLGVTFGALGAPVHLDGINRRVLETSGQAVELPPQGASCPAERLHLVSVGRPLEQTRLQIMDENGQPLGERVCGEIWVKGAGRMRGYADEDTPAANAAALRTTRLVGDWLATGDLGYLADGELYVVGRASDVIKTARGRTLMPDEIELFVNSVDGIRAGSAAAFPVPADASEDAANLLVIAYELQAGTAEEQVERTVRAFLRKYLGIDPHALVALSPDSVPRTHSGKVRRSLARQLYLADRLDRHQRAADLDPARRALFWAHNGLSRWQQHLLERVNRWLGG